MVVQTHKKALKFLLPILKDKYLPIVLGIPFFFCLHHYEGIVFDSVLYLLQVIHSVAPERFINDPPFMFGNQDSLGFFTPLYRLFLNHFSIATGTKLMCFIFQLSLIIAMIFLVKEIGKTLRNRLWILPTTLIFIAMSADRMPHYGVLFVNFVQNYNCSRLPSIALGVGGLALLFSKKKWPSLITFIIGTVIHPLSAGWGLPVWLFVFFPKLKHPITFLAAIIPLSCFIHIGPFDTLPENWLKRPLLHQADFWDISRIAIYFFFLWHYVPRTTNSEIAKISKALAWVLAIAYYWNLWGCFGKHMLLYQLQTWRAEWLAWAVITPFFTYITFLEIRKKKKINTFLQSNTCFELCSYALTLFLPYNMIIFLVIHAFTRLKKIATICNQSNKVPSNIYLLSFFLLISCIAAVTYSNILQLTLENVIPTTLMIGSYSKCYLFVRSFVIAEIILSIGFLAITLHQKNWASALFFGLFIIFPSVLMFPLLGLSLLFFSTIPKRNKLIFVALFVAAIIDGLSVNRPASIFQAFSGPFKHAFCLTTLLFTILTLSVFFKRRLRKISVIILLLALSSYAACFWDTRSSEKKLEEDALEQFKSSSVFSYIRDRGKIFFYVSGENRHLPRLQFLSGAYLDYNTHIGEIFFKEQFFEAQKRDNYLFYKENRHIANEKKDFYLFASTILANSDSLVDRIDFLCKMDEINYLVSDFNKLPYSIHDSTIIKGSNKSVYLYQCPISFSQQ
jgi:hypothetical protein